MNIEPKNNIKGFILRSVISFGMMTATLVIVGVLMIPTQPKQSQEHEGIATTVEVTKVEKHDLGINFKVSGEVKPFRSLNIVPEVAGRVVFKADHCRMGRSIKQGDLILRIDPTDYQLAVDQLTETVTQAKTDITENKVQIENTEKELALSREQLDIRQRELQRYESSTLPGVYSSAELDTVRSSLISSRESVQKQENQLRVYQTQQERLESHLRKEEVNLAQAKLNLERTEVKAPISGVVTSDAFEVNSYVQKGESVAALLDTSQLEITCNLQMKQILWIWQSSAAKEARDNADFDGYDLPPTPASIVFELDGLYWRWQGTLQALNGGGVDSAVRMVPCRVVVDNPRDVQQLARLGETFDALAMPPSTLLAGMFVDVIVHASPDIPLYRVPEKALLPGNRVWTATDGTLRRHDIRVATTNAEGVLFYADPSAPNDSDLVVVSPMASASEGDHVDIMNRVTPETSLARQDSPKDTSVQMPHPL